MYVHMYLDDFFSHNFQGSQKVSNKENTSPKCIKKWHKEMAEAKWIANTASALEFT